MTTQTRCRAKNPSTCWRHGAGLGFDANRTIKETLNSQFSHTHDELTSQALKTYDSHQLASVIMVIAENDPDIDMEQVKSALLMAADLHKTDTRANRSHHDRTPYIEHPLRNTLRIYRYGCKKESLTTLFVGELLHDTVEDHPFEIAREYAKIEPRDEHHAREIAYEYLQKKFSQKSSRMVEGMSNPISENKYAPAAEKNVEYVDHLEEEIEDGYVLVGKVSDFTDNALSLHHTESGMSSASTYKKATKYLLAIPVFEARLKKALFTGDSPLPERAIEALLRQMSRGREKLLEIQARNAPVAS